MSGSRQVKLPMKEFSLQSFADNDGTLYVLMVKDVVKDDGERLRVSFDLVQVQADDAMVMKDRTIRYSLASSKRATIGAFEAMLDMIWAMEPLTHN